jgi:hypothetical protein
MSTVAARMLQLLITVGIEEDICEVAPLAHCTASLMQ